MTNTTQLWTPKTCKLKLMFCLLQSACIVPYFPYFVLTARAEINEIALIDMLQFQKKRLNGVQANSRYVRSSCTGAKSTDKSGHAPLPLSRLLRAEVWTCLLWSSMALASPMLTSWSSPGRRKTVIWKHVLILPSSCTVTHIPLSQPILLVTRGKWGSEGKQVSPMTMTLCHFWSV